MTSITPIDIEDLPDDGVAALRRWFDEAASDQRVDDARLACLATADAGGSPDARMVVVRDLGPEGALVATSARSAKAEHLQARAVAALVFWWEPLLRQVRVRGQVARLPDADADAHFERLARPSRIAAWASDQRTELPDRSALEAALAAAERRFPDEVPRPPTWAAYRLLPDVVELWQGHAEDPLHDRFRYERRGPGWRVTRVAP